MFSLTFILLLEFDVLIFAAHSENFMTVNSAFFLTLLFDPTSVKPTNEMNCDFRKQI
jgi:hypothetical protein